MNEPLLRSVLRLYALFAGSDGLLEEEKHRISHFLFSHLSPESVAHFIVLLEKWSAEYAQNATNPEWVDNELGRISVGINRELTISQRYYLFLELIELSLVDGHLSKAEDSLLQKFSSLINLSPEHTRILRDFATGKQVFSRSDPNILLISAQKPESEQKANHWEIPGFTGKLAVLKLPELDTYFVQYQGKSEPVLNGNILQNGISRIWAPGATLRQQGIPPVFFSFVQERISDTGHKPQIDFQASGIGLTFPDGKVGLKDVNLAEKGGRMVAIMGGSGCGKSTLLNVLNGNEKPDTGTVRINGLDVHLDSEKLEGVIGYIPQDDLLNERLTVFQNMYFAAKFSFGNLPEEDIIQKCNAVLNSLGLSSIKDKEVGSPAKKTISGGQRKRLNIGLELIREPWVLFVDEPTSGLSSSDSLRTMELLKNLSLNGKLVFVIIHQPSEEIFKMFDRLMVMDAGGIPVFYGNPLEAVPYFRREARLPGLKNSGESADAAEIFNILETKLVQEDGSLSEKRKFPPQEWEQRFKRNHQQEEILGSDSTIPNLIKKPGFVKQIQLYFRRDILAKAHDKQYMLINLLEAPFLALLLALVVRYAPAHKLMDRAYAFATNENIPAYFFMSVIVALFMGMSVSAEEIIRDRLLLKRERFLHLNRDAYLIAKILLLFTLSLLHTLAFVLISDWVLEVPYTGMEFWMVLFAAACCANLLGLVLSDTFRNAVVVYILIPLLLIPQIVLGGALVRYDRLSPVFENSSKVPAVGDLMVSRWAYEAIMVAQFKNNPFQSRIFDIEAEKEEVHYRRSAYLPALESLCQEIVSDKSRNPEIRLKRTILLKEIQKSLARFGMSANAFLFLEKNENPSPEQMASIHEILKGLNRFYNQRFKELQKKLDAVFAEAGTGQDGKNKLTKLREQYQNEQIARYLSEDFALQPRLEITLDGVIRKEKPGYQMPEPEHALDFRTHLYSPFKHLAGWHYPTESFNILIIWLISLTTFLILRFRLLRILFRIRI
jgi:ABC-type multidrug transport system ATPase subunit